MALRLHAKVITTHTDAGAVLLHMRSGCYWQLNLTGTHILRQLLDGCKPDRVAADLAERYNLPSGQTHDDVGNLLDKLRTAGLVITS